MAQSKSFFGLRRGSTKSLTFSTFNGKQVTKDRVTDVKNPRTEAQMINRMLNYTAMSAYSAMKEIVDHSFASKSYGLQSMRHFLSKNYSLLKYGTDTLRYSSYKGGAVPSAFLVSEGSLAPIPMEIIVGDGEINITFTGKTVGDLKKHLGLNAGDYFTVVALTDDPNNQFLWVRLYVPESSDDSKDVSLNLMSPESNRDATKLVTIAPQGEDKTMITFDCNFGNISFGTVIASAKRGDTWQRSTNYLEKLMGDDVANYAEALATYPVGASYILNGGDK